MIRNRATPNAKFITWLAIQNRSSIKDRVNRWKGDCDIDCVLCDGGSETLHHLLFDCSNAKQVREGVFNFLAHTWNASSCEDEIKIMVKLNKKKTNKAKLIVICWT